MARDMLALAKGDSKAFEQALGAESDAKLWKLTDELEDAQLYPAAELVYRLLCQRKPKDERCHIGLSRNLYYEQREAKRADAFLRDAVRAFPKSNTLLSMQGTNLGWGMQRHREALVPYRRALELDTEDAGSRSCLAWCLLWLGETAEGLEQAREALRCNEAGDDDAEVNVVCQLYLYLCGGEETRAEALVSLVRLVAEGARMEDWDVSGLIEQARAQHHPELEYLPQLARVVLGEAPSSSLGVWPAWRANQPRPKPTADDHLLEALLAAIQHLSPGQLFEAASAANIQVSAPKHPFPNVPFQNAYPTPDALLMATAAHDMKAACVVIEALGLLEGDAQIELMSRLVEAEAPLLSRPAEKTLVRSRDDRALATLMRAFEPRARLSPYVLRQSAHPAMCDQVRAVLAEASLHDFVPRPRPSIREWQSLSDEEQAALGGSSPEGERPRAVIRAKEAISLLGAMADGPSLELFLRVFQQHPDDWLRLACAHALTYYDDELAIAALRRAWGDADATIGSIAVRAAIAREPAGIWAAFERHIEAVSNDSATADDLSIVYRMLSAVHGGSSPRKVEAARDPLLLEPRLCELAARWRAHPRLDDPSRRLLELLPKPELNALLARIQLKAKPAAKEPRIVLPKRRDFVTRYRAGEHAVWNELVKHTPALLAHGDLHEEGMAVAKLLMQRVRQNTDAVRATLVAAGASLEDEERPAADEDLERLTSLVGPLPIALHALWTVCGSLQLMPKHASNREPSYGNNELEAEGISLIALDPLAIDGPDIGWQLDEYEAELAETHRDLLQPLFLSVAPDYLHKQNISGGSAYAFELPTQASDAVDPDLLEESHETTLVEYLRICFAQGGFPLLEVARRPVDDIYINHRVAFESVQGSWAAAADRLLGRLRKDLIEF
jgi:Flp pilus assembly protein TadD